MAVEVQSMVQEEVELEKKKNSEKNNVPCITSDKFARVGFISLNWTAIAKSAITVHSCRITKYLGCGRHLFILSFIIHSATVF